MSTKINQDVNGRVQGIITELNALVKEREEVVHGIIVGRVAQEHVLMLGPGGTGKSFLARSVWSHIDGAQGFEVAFDETTDPSAVFGPPDIPAMVKEGKSRRVGTHMLPEATDAFLDEFFNGNQPLLHSLQPVLNERIWHNNGLPSAVPLRQSLMGSNKINADVELAPLFDRVHIRYPVNYTTKRDNQLAMVAEAVSRMAILGRGVGTNIASSVTTVTVDELDVAHKEALDLDVEDPVMNLFLDIRDELQGKGVHVSDRRMVEGMAAVLANAWVNNHDSVKPSDLSILANMWWVVQDHEKTTKEVVLAATNPGEKAAMDLLNDLDDIKKEVKSAVDSGLDDERKRRVGVEAVRNADKVLREAKGYHDQAVASGADLRRIQETIDKTEAFKIDVGKQIFGLDPSAIVAMTAANA